MTVIGATPCALYLARLQRLHPISVDTNLEQVEISTAVDMLLRCVEECWERLRVLAAGFVDVRRSAGLRDGVGGDAEKLDRVLMRLRRDADCYQRHSTHLGPPSQEPATTCTALPKEMMMGVGQLGRLEVLYARHSTRLRLCAGKGTTANPSQQQQEEAGPDFSVVDFAVAPLLSFHIRLCPVPTAAAYPTLVGRYTQFREAASPAMLALLEPVAVASTAADTTTPVNRRVGSQLAPLELHVLRLVKSEKALRAIESLAQQPPEQLALQPTAVASLAALPLVCPSMLPAVVGGAGSGAIVTQDLSMSTEARYCGLLGKLFGVFIAAGFPADVVSPQEGTANNAQAQCRRVVAGCLRLARLYSLDPQGLPCPYHSLALACQEQGFCALASGCAATARYWHLQAFDIASASASATCEPEYEELRKLCLLHARTADLVDATTQQQQAGSSEARRVGLAFSRPFGEVRHRLALHRGQLIADSDAWVAAFPEAAVVVEGILSSVLEAVVRRGVLLAGERADTAALRESQALVKSSSGGLRRLERQQQLPDPSPPLATADAAGQELPRSHSVQMRDHVGTARPRHILAPPAAQPRRGLAALLNAVVASGPKQPVVVAEGANIVPQPGGTSMTRRLSGAGSAENASPTASVRAKNGGAFCAQLHVVPQANTDACGFHAMFNAVTLGRALTSPKPADALAWLSDLRSQRAFEADMAATQAALRAEGRRRAQREAGAGWDRVRSIMERNFLGWLLASDDRVATLGGEHTFSVVEFAEGQVKSFDLQETVEFHREVLQSFATAVATDEGYATARYELGGSHSPQAQSLPAGGLVRLILLGTTEGKESGHWSVLAAVLPPPLPLPAATAAAGGAECRKKPARPPAEFALLDSQNKVGTKTQRQAVALLVRCLRGEASLLDGVLAQRLAPLLHALHAEAESPDPALARLRATKPAAAWRQDEVHSLEVLLAAGATLPQPDAEKLRQGVERLLRGVNWGFVSQAPAAESSAVAEMARVLVAAGSAVGGVSTEVLELPAAAKLKPSVEIVAALTTMGFSVYGARRAALAVANRSVEVAVSWCFEHSGDSDFDTPIEV